MTPHAGRCLCGDVRYVASGTPAHVVHCYCSMCRRSGGAAFQTYARFERGQVAFSGEPLREYPSSENVVRGFCPRCGSSLTFAYRSSPGELWITAGSLDDPDALRPTSHFCSEDRVAWVHPDALPVTEREP